MSISGELFDYSDYELPIPPSDEVLDFEDRFGIFLEVDWHQRAHYYFETHSPLTRVPELGALAMALTKRDIMHEIAELDAHLKIDLVPDYFDF